MIKQWEPELKCGENLCLNVFFWGQERGEWMNSQVSKNQTKTTRAQNKEKCETIYELARQEKIHTSEETHQIVFSWGGGGGRVWSEETLRIKRLIVGASYSAKHSFRM